MVGTVTGMDAAILWPPMIVTRARYVVV